jgi:hypothetical protein
VKSVLSLVCNERKRMITKIKLAPKKNANSWFDMPLDSSAKPTPKDTAIKPRIDNTKGITLIFICFVFC